MKGMSPMLSTDFLIQDDHYKKTDQSSTQLIFHFHDIDGFRHMRGLIGIPTTHEHRFWFKYFEKGSQRDTPADPIPSWFTSLVEKAEVYVEKKHRLKKIFS